jgi:hypothetical protein
MGAHGGIPIRSGRVEVEYPEGSERGILLDAVSLWMATAGSSVPEEVPA